MQKQNFLNKLIVTIGISFFLISCNQNNQVQNEQKNKSQRKIDNTLMQIFQEKYPTYNKNELIKSKALEELVTKIDSLAPLNYLDDIPLNIWSIKKNPHGKGALVQFYSNCDRDDRNEMLSNLLGFDIIGFMSEDLASTLNNKSKYYLFGKNFKRLNNDETYVIVNQTYHSPEPEISEDLSYSGTFNLMVGVFLCEVDSVHIIGQ